jgi:hypothetical protein
MEALMLSRSTFFRPEPISWFTFAVLFAFAGSAIVAQKAPAKADTGPTYDVKTEVKIKGKVDEVKVVGETAKTKVTKLVVKSATESVELTIGPKSFLDDMGVSYTAGDDLEITGSKVKQGDADTVLVRQIVKGNDTLVLRDDKGKPYWN